MDFQKNYSKNLKDIDLSGLDTGDLEENQIDWTKIP
jgi:hypothetical protein